MRKRRILQQTTVRRASKRRCKRSGNVVSGEAAVLAREEQSLSEAGMVRVDSQMGESFAILRAQQQLGLGMVRGRRTEIIGETAAMVCTKVRRAHGPARLTTDGHGGAT